MNAPFQNAKWIAPSELSPSPVITRHFKVDGGRAILYVTGLGYFEAALNGVRLGDEWFQPVVSDYEPRDVRRFTHRCIDSFTHRIYYRTFDVTDLLQDGDNALTIRLGGGFYTQNERVGEGDVPFADRVKCIFALNVGQQWVCSDGTETWQDSIITQSKLFLGERHDPTAAPRSGQVTVVPDTATVLCEQIGTPDRLIRTIAPQCMAEVEGRTVYDAGENISGVVRVTAKPGFVGEVTLRFAENLNEDGSLNFDTTGADYMCPSGVPQIQTDTFVCDGEARVFEPKFVWHAFRYFDVQGEADALEVLVIHADTPVTCTFDSDSEGLNFLYDVFLRTQLNNMHGSYPSDCPHRERLGYTGDGQIVAPTAMLMLDSEAFYRKWIQDILDCQDPNSGHVQHTAPFQGGGGGPGGWGCAMVLVPWYFYRQWGDGEMLRRCYQPMRRWLDFLKNSSENGLVVREIDGGWCLGDWCTLHEPTVIPQPLVNTFYLVKCLRIMVRIAEIIGESQDIPAYSRWDEAICAALRSAYYNEATSLFADGNQGADAYMAAIGLQDAEMCAANYGQLGHFDTGFLGTDILCELLTETGHVEEMARCLSTEEPGGYLYMKRHGATTIWECWDGAASHASHDHPMFGAPTRQLFHGILGIRQSEDGCGWQQVVLNPYLPQGMNHASGSILTPKGRISMTLTRTQSGVEAKAVVPAGVEVQAAPFVQIEYK